MQDYDYKTTLMRVQVYNRASSLKERCKKFLHFQPHQLLGLPYKDYKKLVDNPTPRFYKAISELYFEVKKEEMLYLYFSLKNDVSKPLNTQV